MKVISTGEKIRKLRNDIGLNQDALTNDKITRSLISMIENNKRNLTHKAAKVIASALNQYYGSLGKEITADFLLETETEQAQRLVKERLTEIQLFLNSAVSGNEQQIEENFAKLISFAQDWQLDAMIAELQEARARFRYKIRLYNEALTDFFSAQSFFLKEEDYHKVTSIYNMIGSCYYFLLLPRQALICYEQAEYFSHQGACFAGEEGDALSDRFAKLRMRILFNKVLCHRRLKNYDHALKEIAYFKKLPYMDDEHYHNILLLEANTYNDLGNYVLAARLYSKLLSKADKLPVDTLQLVYINYAELYQRQNNYEKGLEYIRLAKAWEDRSSHKYIFDVLLHESEYHYQLQQPGESLQILEEGILLSKRSNRTEISAKFHMLRIEMFFRLKRYGELETLLREFSDLISDHHLFDYQVDLHTYYILLYSHTENLPKCAEHSLRLKELRRAV